MNEVFYIVHIIQVYIVQVGFSTLALQQQDSFICFVFVCVHGLFVCLAVCFLTCVDFFFRTMSKVFCFALSFPPLFPP